MRDREKGMYGKKGKRTGGVKKRNGMRRYCGKDYNGIGARLR